MSQFGNPIHIIQSRLQTMRSKREQEQTDIEALEREKNAIRRVLPKVVHELTMTRESLEAKQREMAILDKAIAEIESKFAHILYTPEFFGR